MKALQQRLPPKVWLILEKAQALSEVEKDDIIDELTNLFDYTSNPLLGQSGTAIQALFKYYAAECAGRATARAIFSYALDIPFTIQSGIYVYDGVAYPGNSHLWQWTKEGVREPLTGNSSPLWRKVGVTNREWQQEMDVLTSAERMAWIDREQDRILLGLDKQVVENNIEKIRQQKDGLQQKPKTLEEVKKDTRSLAYYKELRNRYEAELDKLKSAALDMPQIQEVLRQISLVDFALVENEFQLMAYGHYLFGALNQLNLKIEAGKESRN